MESPLSKTWVPETHTQRKAHNHIFQSGHGIEGCPACADLNHNWHMTWDYGVTGHRWLIATGRVVPMY